ncbi:MAG: carbohydrate kinase [Bacteroidota bacterium]|nr:carbohydrate kinase [Bacteroidota bacterium]
MNPIPVILIFDIGKTNKKVFLFDEAYQIVMERSVKFAEIQDEDGFPCDDVHELTKWVRETVLELMEWEDYSIRAINYSAYGASFVHINETGDPVTPLYNYLKPCSPGIQDALYAQYGGETQLSVETASPVLGNLNSGIQLYSIQVNHPDVFKSIAYSLHLPQFISYLITGKPVAEITSIGCHTLLWDFVKHGYHSWVTDKGLDQKFPDIDPSNTVSDLAILGKLLKSGIGLHDSSSALIPYLQRFTEPFILLSTGTWCISMNPFNEDPLTSDELSQDCLCYLGYLGKPVKASRLFAGHEHEEQVSRLANHFHVPRNYYEQVAFDPTIFWAIQNRTETSRIETGLHHSAFSKWELSFFASYTEAYHQLIFDIIRQQQRATALVFSKRLINKLYVDGGFAHNPVFMNMLATVFPAMEVFAADVSQASAIGAALAIHHHWNPLPVPNDLISLKKYTPVK